MSKVTLQDRSSLAPGLVQFGVKGKGGTYAAGPAVDPALVLPEAGQCFESTYPAVFPATPSCAAASGGRRSSASDAVGAMRSR